MLSTMPPDLFYWLALLLLIVNLALLGLVAMKAAARKPEAPEPVVREELRAGREEAERASRELREEVARTQRESAEQLGNALHRIGQAQGERLAEISRQLEALTKSKALIQARHF